MVLERAYLYPKWGKGAPLSMSPTQSPNVVLEHRIHFEVYREEVYREEVHREEVLRKERIY